MTLAEEKIKPSSKRFSLVRLEPARYLNNAYRADLSVFPVYAFDMPYPVATVSYIDNVCEEVETFTGDYQYRYDEAAGVLYIRLPSFEAPVVATYYLFYSSGDTEFPTDPTTTSGSKRFWNPSLTANPTVRSSFRNVVSGILSISASSVEIANGDGEFPQYLTDDDSFANKVVSIWVVVNDAVQKIYTGKCVGLMVTKKKVVLDLDDALSALNQQADFGDSQSDLFFKSGTRTIAPVDEGKPIPFIMGRSVVGAYTGLEPVGAIGDAVVVDYNQSGRAVCTSYDAIPSGTVNRTWTLCRSSASGFKTLNLGTVGTVTLYTNVVRGYKTIPANGSTYNSMQIASPIASHNAEVGDSFVWGSSSHGNGNYALVTLVTSTVINLMVFSSAGAAIYTSAVPTSVTVTSFTYTANQAPALTYYNGSDNAALPLIYGHQFTYSIDTLSSGNKLMTVTLNNNFESTGYKTFVAYVLPGRDTLGYRATAAPTDAYHGAALKLLVSSAGCDTIDDTYTAADADFPAKVSFTVPNVGQPTYGSYLDYCQQILASTLGYLYPNAEGKLGYKLLTGTAAGEEKTSNTVLAGTPEVRVDYRDISTGQAFRNDHLKLNPNAVAPVTGWSEGSYLHGTFSVRDIEHVLESIVVVCASTGNARCNDFVYLLSSRRATYAFQDASESLDLQLGDDVTVETGLTLGDGTATVNCKVSSISVSADKVSIEATDLLGL